MVVGAAVLSKTETEGQIRLTGLNSTSSGRIEVFLDGKWGTVSRKLTNATSNWYLAYGKTVCYQINHYNGDNSIVTTGTVTSLNKLLQSRNHTPINASGLIEDISLYDLKCGTPSGKYPQHILRCSFMPSNGSRKSHEDDLAVICGKNISNYDYPFIGQIRLRSSSKDEVNQGVLEIYGGTEWGNVCYEDFDGTAANTTCRQLGYTNAKSFSKTVKQSSSTTWLDLVSCGSDDTNQCLWKCLTNVNAAVFYKNITRKCEKSSYVAVTCEFNVASKSIATSPYIGNTCQVPPYAGSSNYGTVIIVAVLVLLVLIVSMVTSIMVCICCCCIPTCLCFQIFNKTKYNSI